MMSTNAMTFGNPVTLILFSIATLLIPVMTIVTTSFVRFAIVLNLVRQAIGAQSIPPTFVLNVIAAALTITVMMTPMSAVVDAATSVEYANLDYKSGLQVGGRIIAPLIDFMEQNTGDVERRFMLDVRDDKWSESARAKFDEHSIFVILPAFVMSEVRRGFEIGFLMYIPFVIIDVVIATLTTAMGMTAVSPNVVALPLKLLYFVYIEGWTQLAQALVHGYI